MTKVWCTLVLLFVSLSLQLSDSQNVIRRRPIDPKFSDTGFRIDCHGVQPCKRGAVQVFDRSRRYWGNICADGWGQLETELTCRYLNFSSVLPASPMIVQKMKLTEKARNAPVFLRNVTCSQGDTTIQSCNKYIALFNQLCPKNRFAGVDCHTSMDEPEKIEVPKQRPNMKIKTSTRKKGSELKIKIDCRNKKCNRGAVLAYNEEKGYWGPMCSQGWSPKAANVACASMNFKSDSQQKKHRAKPISKLSKRNKALPVTFKYAACKGRESRFGECSLKEAAFDESCPGNMYAGVVCRGEQIFGTAAPAEPKTQRPAQKTSAVVTPTVLIVAETEEAESEEEQEVIEELEKESEPVIEPETSRPEPEMTKEEPSDVTDNIDVKDEVTAKAVDNVVHATQESGVHKIEQYEGNLDLMFVIDSSFSVKFDDFDNIKRFIRLVSSKFDVGTSTHVGVYQYAAVLPDSNDLHEISLGQHSSAYDFNQAVNSIDHKQGDTYTAHAVTSAVRSFKRSPRYHDETVTKVMIVLTHAQADDADNLMEASMLAKDEGINTFGIGIGGSVRFDDLSAIVADRYHQIFMLSRFDDLTDIVSEVQKQIIELIEETKVEVAEGTRVVAPQRLDSSDDIAADVDEQQQEDGEEEIDNVQPTPVAEEDSELDEPEEMDNVFTDNVTEDEEVDNVVTDSVRGDVADDDEEEDIEGVEIDDDDDDFVMLEEEISVIPSTTQEMDIEGFEVTEEGDVPVSEQGSVEDEDDVNDLKSVEASFVACDTELVCCNSAGEPQFLDKQSGEKCCEYASKPVYYSSEHLCNGTQVLRRVAYPGYEQCGDNQIYIPNLETCPYNSKKQRSPWGQHIFSQAMTLKKMISNMKDDDYNAQRSD